MKQDKKPKCRYCGKGGIIKYYIIADDMEHPKPYHTACIRKLEMEVIMKLSDIMNPNIEKTLREFSEKYYDKNSVSGLKQRDYLNFRIMVDSIKDFLSQKLQKAIQQEQKRIGKELKKWFYSEDYEPIEDAIERITGVKV